MKIQLDILYIILYSKNMFFFTDQQQQNKHETLEQTVLFGRA